MIKKIFLLSCFLICGLAALPQELVSPYQQADIQLKAYFRELYNSEEDKTIDSLNNLILDVFQENLQNPESFNFKWDSLIMIGRLHSTDQKLNVFTWFVRNQKGQYTYYGFLQYNFGSVKKPDIKVFPLKDKTKGIKNPETLMLSPENWLGCVYYNVYTFKHRRETCYALLGYNFNNDFSDKKYIEALIFNKEKEAFFAGVFKAEFQTLKRVIVEYSAQLVASIKYDEKLKMIVLDHLAPFEPMFTGNYRFYGPDGSYDGYVFHKGEFLLRKDIDARNSEVRR